ncbi:MAG: Gfo/Idh/MocA family oxidoreductase [Bacteroidales bacterium]
MKTSRRDFLKTAAAAGAGAGAVTTGLLSGCTAKPEPSVMAEIESAATRAHTQSFNMSGYGAPPLEKVRIGVVGIGDRGIGSVERLCYIEGTEIVALCDIRQVAIDGAQKILESFGLDRAVEYTGSDESWKAMCERDDIDLVYICTPWKWHTPISVYAMENGSHVACEVPIARTVDEAWQLVETSERTRKHCMQLENCCYDFFELLTLNMARQGLFGDILHAEGAYIHNLMGYNFKKPEDERLGDGAYTGMWRLRENATRNGNLYPTHGLGPVCQVMNINRGDRMDYLASMSTNDFSMGVRAKELATTDSFYDEWKDAGFRGNMNTHW